MSGLSKYEGKDRRRQRRALKRNHIAHDLGSPKYHQRVVDRKRVENDDGSYYLQDVYLDDE